MINRRNATFSVFLSSWTPFTALTSPKSLVHSLQFRKILFQGSRVASSEERNIVSESMCRAAGHLMVPIFTFREPVKDACQAL